MDMNRTMQHKPRAVRKLLDSYSSEKVNDEEAATDGEKAKFKFPPPPRLPIPHFSPPPFLNGSDDVDTSDSQSDQTTRNGVRRHSNRIKIPPGRNNGYSSYSRGYQSDGSPARFLPPIGVFWDIENCQIPRGKSAVAVAQAIRDRFFDGYQEAEFLVVCDVKKENCQVIQELNDAQVNLIHVGATSKNAADEKLRHSMRRFADIHGFPAAIVLISGDINFAPDLCDLRHRKKIYIILVHNEACSESLILCANEHYSFNDLVELLPLRGYVKSLQQPVEVIVRNLPRGPAVKQIRRRLKFLSENCGGKVGYISESTANIRFPSYEFAMRAQKRLDGELVFGNQISVGFPQRVSQLNEPEYSRDVEKTLFGNGGLGRVESTSTQNQYSALQQSSFMPHTNFGSSQWLPPGVLSAWNGNSNDQWNSRGLRNIQRSQTDTSSLLSNQENILSPPKQNAWDQAPWIWHYSNGESSSQPKTRSVLANKNERNVEEKIIKPISIPEELKAEYGVRQLKTCGTAQKVAKVVSPSEGAGKKVETVAKRPKVPSSPKLSRRSLDSMRLPGKNNAVSTSVGRKCRTPSPYTMLGPQIVPVPKLTSSVAITRKGILPIPNECLENEKFFNPIPSLNIGNTPIELHVTNLDQNIDPKEMKKLLMAAFGEHVMVCHVSVFMQSEGSFAASVKLRTLQDAQYAISQLHRKKIGFKRIMICYAHSPHPQNPQFIRWQIVSLLQEVPGHKLPLFKFLELFESRYLSTVSVSDLYRLRDVCVITEENIGRMVSLNPDHRNTPSPHLISNKEIEPYCSVHFKGIQCPNKGWAEQEAAPLPNVREPLTTFSTNVVKLLNSHNNILPLASICDCYEAYFGKLNVHESGVPLEHFVTWVNKVELALTNGIKYLKPSSSSNQDEKPDDVSKSVSPSLVNQLYLFSRELVDLLKTQPHCQLMFNRFVPAYHHHFGRQCRVADYGFIKLIELLEALPNVVQVIGEGSRRIVTLSYRAQVRRFTSELLRVLKAQPCKQLNLTELPHLFERTFNRPFDTVDYGLCHLEDLIYQLPENTFVVRNVGNDIILAIPKREQTAEEMERTKIFAKEVVELLSHAPQCSILFYKFIPAYHHHYGHQCRVADFGFSKLIELFEAIPDVVKLDEDGEGERRVTLTTDQKMKVLSEQISELVAVRYPPGLPLSSLCSAFLWQYGHALKPENYEAESLESLLAQIASVEVMNLDCGLTLVPVDQTKIKELINKIMHLLMDSPNGKMPLNEIKASFNKCYHRYLTREQVKSFLKDIQIEESPFGSDVVISLSSLHQFARRIYQILLKSDGCKLALSALEEEYLKIFLVPIQPAQYGFPSLSALIRTIPDIVTLRGKGSKQFALLNKNFIPDNDGKIEPSSTRNMASSDNSDMNKNDKNRFKMNAGSPKKWETHVWLNGSNFESRDNNVPVVMLPEMSIPPDDIVTSSCLISPCKSLLPATTHPMLHNDFLPYVKAPDPSELPIPKIYLSPGLIKEENSNMNCDIDDFSAGLATICDDEIETKSQTKDVKDRDTPNSATKRKLRLAAQFQTPIEFL